MAPKILLVTTVAGDDRLREEIPSGADVRIVAPAAKVSALGWLTNAEDDARAEALEAAERTAAAIGDDASVEIDRTSQNMDAAEDIRDALRQFPADEIVVVTSAGDEVGWLEEEAVREALAAPGLPVRRISI